MTDAYEQFIKWKQSEGGRRFEDAINQAERAQQLQKYSAQFKSEPKKDKKKEKQQEIKGEDPEHARLERELAGLDEWGEPIRASLNKNQQTNKGGQQTTNLKNEGGIQGADVVEKFKDTIIEKSLRETRYGQKIHKKDYQKQEPEPEKPKTAAESLAENEEDGNNKGKNYKKEKFAGLVNENTWKYNSKSYYNNLNDGPGMKKVKDQEPQTYYQDQRAYFLHRRHLADAIERARNENQELCDAKKDAVVEQENAAAERLKNKKEYDAMKKEKIMKLVKAGIPTSEVQDTPLEDEDPNSDLHVRDGRQRTIGFEQTGVRTFSVSFNFTTPDDVVRILKKYSAMYNKKRKEWTASIAKYKECAIEVSSLCRARGIFVDLIPQQVFDLSEWKIPFSDESKTRIFGHRYEDDLKNKPSLNQLPKSLYNNLYAFQKVGVQYGVDHFGRCLIGDEMGVGKTIQAIAIAYLYRRDWPVVVICPSSLRFQWRDEFMNWLPIIREEDIQCFTSAQDEFNTKCCIYILSYNIGTRLAGIIGRKGFKVCIVDESHYLKSRDSLRAKNLVPVLMRTKRILLLSGTPILARPAELYNQLRIIRPDIFFSFNDFGRRYCNPKEQYYGLDWSGSKNQRELHMMIERNIMIRRIKQDVLTELPSKRRQKIAISTDSNQVKKIHWMLKKIKSWQDKIGRKGENIFGALKGDFEDFVKNKGMDDPNIARLDDKYAYLVNAYGLTGLAKIKGILEFTETLIENRCKFLIFAHHYDVLDAIEEQVIRRKISHIRIDGKIEIMKRYEAVRKFQTDQDCLVAVLSLTASCTGITLTAASTVVFAEMTWTPGIMVQAEDRAHRIGQVAPVNVYYLIGENTLDAMIYPRIKLKSEVFANVIDGMGTNFHLENEYEYESMKHFAKLQEEKRDGNRQTKKFEKINSQVMKSLNKEDMRGKHQGKLENSQETPIHQSNISDFFFVNRTIKSRVQGHQKKKDDISAKMIDDLEADALQGQSEEEEEMMPDENPAGPEKILQGISSQIKYEEIGSEINNQEQEENSGQIIQPTDDLEMQVQIPGQESSLQVDARIIDSNINGNYDSELVQIGKKSPLPDPPLGKLNLATKAELFDIGAENWDEGSDTKHKAYNWIRNEKEKMFDQNQEWKKFRGIFRGLYRTHVRAKQPNKITEYELPVDMRTVRHKHPHKEGAVTGTATYEFDPESVFDTEYAKDDKEARDLQEKLYGKEYVSSVSQQTGVQTNDSTDEAAEPGAIPRDSENFARSAQSLVKSNVLCDGSHILGVQQVLDYSALKAKKLNYKQQAQLERMKEIATNIEENGFKHFKNDFSPDEDFFSPAVQLQEGTTDDSGAFMLNVLHWNPPEINDKKRKDSESDEDEQSAEEGKEEGREIETEQVLNPEDSNCAEFLNDAKAMLESTQKARAEDSKVEFELDDESQAEVIA